MRLTDVALAVCAGFGLTVSLGGQSRAPSTTVSLKTSENQSVIGPINVETSANGQTRIQFWLNTPTYLAKSITLEASRFTIRGTNGGQLIESDSAVLVTGFALGQDINKNPMLQNASDNQNAPGSQNAPGTQLLWERGFKLQILADGTPQWFCCPRTMDRATF